MNRRCWRGASIVAIALHAAGCAGQTGTIQLELTTAEGADLLARIERLRVSMTDPPSVVEATRTADGFHLQLEVDADGQSGALLVDGFDASDTLVASGRSPPFPIAAIDARIVIFLGAPNSITTAPVRLPAPRRDVASAALSYGLVIAGGKDVVGTTSADLFIYNAYDHSLIAGAPLPQPRSATTLAVGDLNAVYVFGGFAADGTATGTLWRFDTTVPGGGVYRELDDRPELARAGATALRLNTEHFVITGDSPIELTAGLIAPLEPARSLPAHAAVAVRDGQVVALFAGDPIIRLRDGVFDTLPTSVGSEAQPAVLPDGRIVFAGVGEGEYRDLVVVDPFDGSLAQFPQAFAMSRLDPAVAATERYLIVAGGSDVDGVPVPSAEVFDTTTLAPIATIPCVGRAKASAHRLSNDQIAIVGGVPELDVLELFTPDNP